MSDATDELNNQDSLVFQDFQHTSKPEETFNEFPPHHDDDEEEEDKNVQGSKLSMLSFEFYQQFFDVDVKQVSSRMLTSMLPHKSQGDLKSKPDFYGPFWICVTLVMSIGISADLANYHHFTLHRVSTLTLVVFSYWLLMPCLWYLVCRWRGISTSFTHLVCLYGYSLTVFIPFSVLSMVPLFWFRCVLVVCVCLTSALPLALNLRPTFQQHKTGTIMMAIVFLLHSLLALCFMFFFFHGSTPHTTTTSTVAPTISTPPSNKTH